MARSYTLILVERRNGVVCNDRLYTNEEGEALPMGMRLRANGPCGVFLGGGASMCCSSAVLGFQHVIDDFLDRTNRLGPHGRMEAAIGFPVVPDRCSPEIADF
jgi:hypothetical protein